MLRMRTPPLRAQTIAMHSEQKDGRLVVRAARLLACVRGGGRARRAFVSGGGGLSLALPGALIQGGPLHADGSALVFYEPTTNETNALAAQNQKWVCPCGTVCFLNIKLCPFVGLWHGEQAVRANFIDVVLPRPTTLYIVLIALAYVYEIP
jgi:hypothetical protein